MAYRKLAEILNVWKSLATCHDCIDHARLLQPTKVCSIKDHLAPVTFWRNQKEVFHLHTLLSGSGC